MDTGEVVRVVTALADAGVAYGITGGWGVDALLRQRTREHEDVDLGVGADQLATAIDALVLLGYVVHLDQRPARVELRSEHGRVDLHPIVWSADGSGVQQGFGDERFDYPPGSLDALGEIDGHAVRCGTPELQMRFHEGYEPTDRDGRDVAALTDGFGLIPPRAYR